MAEMSKETIRNISTNPLKDQHAELREPAEGDTTFRRMHALEWLPQGSTKVIGKLISG